MATMTLSPVKTLSPVRTLAPVGQAPALPARPVRLTKRGRRLARTAVAALMLVIALASAVFGHIASSSASSATTGSTAATSTVIVQPGQTMWELATAIAPDDDPRDTIARIADLNGLTGAQASTVYPGQRLIVPVVAS